MNDLNWIEQYINRLLPKTVYIKDVQDICIGIAEKFNQEYKQRSTEENFQESKYDINNNSLIIPPNIQIFFTLKDSNGTMDITTKNDGYNYRFEVTYTGDCYFARSVNGGSNVARKELNLLIQECIGIIVLRH